MTKTLNCRNPYHVRMLALKAGWRLVKRGLMLQAYAKNRLMASAPLSHQNAVAFAHYEEQAASKLAS